ncbi:cysteine dioxygenase, partial [Streptomyces sp. NPDC048491]
MNSSHSDLQIAGDILEVQHLLQPAREHPATVAEFAGLARA